METSFSCTDILCIIQKEKYALIFYDIEKILQFVLFLFTVLLRIRYSSSLSIPKNDVPKDWLQFL